MSTDRLIVPGIVKNGVIVPQSTASLPEGARVEIVLEHPQISAELRAEFEAWDRASDEAWAMIDKWEDQGT